MYYLKNVFPFFLMYITPWKRLLSPISKHQNHFHNTYLFCKPILLRVYKADPALKVPQEFTENHKLWLLIVFCCFGFFVGLLVCFECMIHSEAFCSVSVLYSNKGVFLVSTAYSDKTKALFRAHLEHRPHHPFHPEMPVFQLLQDLQKGSSKS